MLDTSSKVKASRRRISEANAKLSMYVRSKRQINHDGGTIIFQSAPYCEEQMEHIANKYINMHHLTLPQMLFCDNYIDSQRKKPQMKRKYYDQHSQLMGQYDISFAFGIPMFFAKDNIPTNDQYQALIMSKFNALKRHLANGADIVIPMPSVHELKSNRLRYFKCGSQVIFHNIGSQDESIPFEYIEEVQEQIHLLKKYAKHIDTVEYYSFKGPIKTNQNHADASANGTVSDKKRSKKAIKNHVSPGRQQHHNYNKVKCVICKKQYKKNIHTQTKHDICNKCLLQKKSRKIHKLHKQNKKQNTVIEELKAQLSELQGANPSEAALVAQINQLRHINNAQLLRVRELEVANKQLQGKLQMHQTKQSILGLDLVVDIDKIVAEKYNESDYSSDGDTAYSSDSSDLSETEKKEIERMKTMRRISTINSGININTHAHKRQDSNLFRCGSPSVWGENQIESLENEMKKQMQELQTINAGSSSADSTSSMPGTAVNESGSMRMLPSVDAEDSDNENADEEFEPQPSPYALASANTTISKLNLLRQNSENKWKTEEIDAQKEEMQQHMIHLLKFMHSEDTIAQ